MIKISHQIHVISFRKSEKCCYVTSSVFAFLTYLKRTSKNVKYHQNPISEFSKFQKDSSFQVHLQETVTA